MSVSIAKFFADIEAIGPGILYSFDPSLGLIASGIVNLIKTEQLGGLSGTQKAQNVIAAAPALIETLNAAEGKTVVDPALVGTVLQSALDTIINTVKLVNNPSQIPAVTTALAPVSSV